MIHVCDLCVVAIRRSFTGDAPGSKYALGASHAMLPLNSTLIPVKHSHFSEQTAVDSKTTHCWIL